MPTTDPRAIIEGHAEPAESVRAALNAYVKGGLGRRVVGVTDRRLIVVRSGYFSASCTT